MNILVLGANGMAGHTISLYLIEKGHYVTTLTRKPLNVGKNINLSITLSTLTELKTLILTHEYDAVINCVGLLNEDAENNKADAVFLNSYLPHFLSDTAKKLKTKVIHMSTDCVFSGREGNYKEDSFKDGDTFYDRSKALGELNNFKDLTFRNSIIGPDINKDGIGLFNWFMKQSGKLRGFDKALWTGVTTITLAKAMEAALIENLGGVYNLVNNQSISKYELLLLFNSTFKNEALEIVPESLLAVDKSLVNTRKDFTFIVPSYEEMLLEMKAWVYSHKNIYPHYFD